MFFNFLSSRGGAVWKLAGLITRRSKVQILLPQFVAQIAQLVEQRTENPRVLGSIPSLGIFLFLLSNRKEMCWNMTMSENANMAELFRSIGWTDEQIVDFLLGVEGRISIEEAARRIKQNSDSKDK